MAASSNDNLSYHLEQTFHVVKLMKKAKTKQVSLFSFFGSSNSTANSGTKEKENDKPIHPEKVLEEIQEVKEESFSTKVKKEEVESKPVTGNVMEEELEDEKKECIDSDDAGDDDEGSGDGDDDDDDDDGSEKDDGIELAIQQSTVNSSSSSSSNSYEQLRLDNIRRNAEFLASLGLASVKPKLTSTLSRTIPNGPRENKRKHSSSTSTALVEPVRRSSRTAGLPPVRYDSSMINEKLIEDDKEEEEEEEEEEEIDYDDSNVFKHMILASESSSSSSSIHNKVYDSLAYNLHPSEPGYTEDLEACYSMHFHTSLDGLLLVGGKSGYVSLLQTPRQSHHESTKLLMSSKCHGRWVSTNKFLSSTVTTNMNSRQLHMITASDDGSIKIWDLTKCSVNTKQSSPKLVVSNDNIHSKRGIYSFDECGGFVVSGSKDRNVCISRVDVDSDMNITREICHDAYHHGVVKSVGWKYEINNSRPYIYVSGGQDRIVCVKDIRQSQEEGSICMFEDNSGVHHVEFDNTSILSNGHESSNLFVVAGLDPVIKVYDMRMLSDSRADMSPHLYEYTGHASSHVKKFKAMLAPHFMSNDVLVCLGEESDNVSFYCLKTVHIYIYIYTYTYIKYI